MQVGERLGCAEATAIYLSRVRPQRNAPRRRRAMIAVLALSGVRASEHTDLVWGRLDHTHGRLVPSDSKTEAGVREIHLSPFVREELALYRASLPREPKANELIFPVVDRTAASTSIAGCLACWSARRMAPGVRSFGWRG